MIQRIWVADRMMVLRQLMLVALLLRLGVDRRYGGGRVPVRICSSSLLAMSNKIFQILYGGHVERICTAQRLRKSPFGSFKPSDRRYRENLCEPSLK